MCIICDAFAGKAAARKATAVCRPCRDAAQDQRDWAWLPKVHLHIHLEGALRLETVVDLAAKHGLTEAAALDDPRGYYLTAEPFANLSALLDRFGRSQRVLRDLADVERVAFEAVEDAHRDRVVALELRYAPSFLSGGHDYSWDDALDAVVAGVTRATAAYANVEVGLLCIAVGAAGAESVRETVDFLLRRRDAFIGFDCAGAELDLAQWAPDFARVRAAGIPCTCHAAEDLGASPSNGRVAVDVLGAVRVGHGLQILRDPGSLAAVLEKRAVLEVSVSSNYLTSAVPSLAAHPARELWNKGVRITVNSDDPGIMDLTLSGEYAVWQDVLGFSDAELVQCNLTALAASFLPAATKKRVYDAAFAARPRRPRTAPRVLVAAALAAGAFFVVARRRS